MNIIMPISIAMLAELLSHNLNVAALALACLFLSIRNVVNFDFVVVLGHFFIN